MLRDDIGEEEAALQCTTDSTTCCSNAMGETRVGEFYLPNGDRVLSINTAQSGYYRNRDTMVVRLHRQSDGTQTGEFRCEIPDASGANVTLFINIGMFI